MKSNGRRKRTWERDDLRRVRGRGFGKVATWIGIQKKWQVHYGDYQKKGDKLLTISGQVLNFHSGKYRSDANFYKKG